MTTYDLPDLRPLTMGQLLDRAIRIYRKRFLTFIGIIAITQIPALIFGIANAFVAGGSFDPFATSTGDPFEVLTNQFAALGILGFVILIAGFALTTIANVAITRAVTDDYFGRDISILEAFGRIQNEWLVLLLASILAGLLAFGLVIWWIVIPCVGWLTGLGMIFFLSLVVAPLVTPIIVIEKRGAGQSIQRAWDLSRRRFWWVFGFALLLSIFGGLILGGPTLLVSLGATAVTGLNSTTSLVIQQVVSSVLSIIYLPLPLICFTLLYFDLRVRTEGFDLSLQTVGSEEGAPSLEHVMRKAPQIGKMQPNRDEMVNFLGITAGFIGLYIGLILIIVAIGAILSL